MLLLYRSPTSQMAWVIRPKEQMHLVRGELSTSPDPVPIPIHLSILMFIAARRVVDEVLYPL
jgi:hypothetical protein